MLREYCTIQKSKYASKIESTGKLKALDETTAQYMNKQGAITELVEFRHEKGITPEPGDYIVKDDNSDTYYLVDEKEWDDLYRIQGFKLI